MKTENTVNSGFTSPKKKFETSTEEDLKYFVRYIVSSSKPLDGDIQKFVNENFWDLV